jgi:hypothetical protein
MSMQQMLLGSYLGYFNDFSVPATLSDFTAYQSASGTTWAISAGKLAASGGSGNQAFLLCNSVTFVDGYVEATMTSADQAGVVIRGTDQNNSYFLAVRDASSVGTPNQFDLFKVVGGTFTAIVSAQAISWTRGVDKKFGIRINGSTISVWVDRVSVYSTTDASLTGVTRAGLYCFGALNNSFNDFSIQV